LIARLSIVKTFLLAIGFCVALGSCGDDTVTAPAPPADTSGPVVEVPATVPEVPATMPDQQVLESNATVERIVDGDTLIAEINGQSERVRLLGIDTPESVAETRPDQCFGEESSDYLKTLLPEGSEITLILDEEARDQYDRLLAYVVRSSDDLFVNLDLLEQGYAGVLIYDPNDHYESRFRDAERTAAADGVGLWGVCGGPDVPLE
jgi:micrococcal nuclease